MAIQRQLSPRMKVVHSIKKWIEDGELSHGEAIPSERTLSERLHVQRPTIRRALRILEKEGVVQTLGPRTRIVAERNEPMAHSIVIASLAKDVTQGKKNGAGWTAAMVTAAMEAVVGGGFNMMLLHPERGTEESLRQIISGCPSGVVIPELTDKYDLHLRCSQMISAAGIPLVVYGGSPELENLDRVVSDHEQGAYELTRLLIERGRKRIVMLFDCTAEWYWVQGRIAGYKRAMAEAGLPALPFVSYSFGALTSPPWTREYLDEQARFVVVALLDYLGPLAKGPPVDAIMLSSDGSFAPVAAACRLLGATPGKEVDIVGYDNYWLESWEHKVEAAGPLATMDKQNIQIGTELVNLLVDRIEGKLPAEPQVRVVRPKLVLY